MSRHSLLLLPGLDGTGIMFRPLLGELEGIVDTRVLSYPQEPACSYEELAERVLDRLPEGDFFILGESFGGPLAVMVADRKPKGLRGLILCATFVSNPSRVFPASLSFLVAPPLFSIWPVSVKAGALTRGRADASLRALMRETKQASRSASLAARTRAALRVDVTERLSRCDYPILSLRGARDLVVRSHNARKILHVGRKVTEVTLDTSHLVLQEDPRRAAQEIVQFITAVG